MIGRLWEYFGVLGISAILLCSAACVLLVVYARDPRRSRMYLIAVGVAFLAMVLGRHNSDNVSNIQVDRTDEVKEAAKTEMQVEPEGGYSYRKGGKVKRDAEMVEGGDKAEPGKEGAEPGKEGAEPGKAGAGPGKAGKEGAEPGKGGKDLDVTEVVDSEYPTMPAEMVIEANQWDGWNLLFNWFVFYGALGALIYDYLVRFNDAFEGALPLPLAGGWLDAVSPKRLSICVDIEQAEVVPELMRRAVRKRETFIYLGTEDPLEGEELIRLKLWRLEKWRWTLPRVRLSRVDDPPSDDFALESTWFGRYAVVVTNEKRARKMLDSIIRFLKVRHETGARARCSVNIIWDCDEPVPPGKLKELIELCLGTNIRLIVTADNEEIAEWGALFEQTVAATA